MQPRKNTPSSGDMRSSDHRWRHPLVGFLGGVGFWISHAVVAIGVIAAMLLTWFDVQIDGAWTIIAPAATMVFGFAVLFAFAGWIARSNR